MTSHTGRTYLNTCLKVPIDPCNNCPAPVYNRSKMYLGRLSATPTTATAVLTKHCETGRDAESKWSCSGIRSLAKFYDSIPDYGDINHLTEEDFYSTLDSLRTTCRELKVKSVNTGCVLEDRSSTTSSSLISCGSRSKKTKKSKKKKKKSNKNPENRICGESQESDYIPEFFNTRKSLYLKESCYSDERKIQESLLAKKSLKNDLAEEVECFKKSLKDFEAEFKRPLSSSLNRNESRSFTRCSSKEEQKEDKNKNSTEKVPVSTTFTSTLRERLRKSLSFNDLHDIPEPIELIELRKKNNTIEKLSFKSDYNPYSDPSKLSNYFKEKPKPAKLMGNVPKITVESPSTDSTTARTFSGKKPKKKLNKSEDDYMPFKIFDLDAIKKDSSKHSSPSPVHPVARPNLAATLRAESCKKKVKELKNSCTYHDTTPQMDWEVRKTPAWKTLSLNETHKDIISLRLATRKAEQALQQREYELNMEIMRQRVKSAPLLLEGPTYWGPQVGKLSHTCQREARRHMCQSNQQRMRRKKNSSRSHSCRRSLFHVTTSPLDCENLDMSANALRQDSDMSQKWTRLQKIYGAHNSTKPQSRSSDHSTNTQQSRKTFCKKKSSVELKSARPDHHLTVENDSGDELSSLDRAFL